MARIVEGELVELPIGGGAWGGTYGLRLRTSEGDTLLLPDVDPDRDRALRFWERIRGEDGDETQLWYLLEDFLGEEYGGPRRG